jgi:ribosome-binding factor A
MTSEGRANRIARRIKEDLSTILLFDVGDPRVSGVFITDVNVDRELAYANIFVSALEGSDREEEILEGLNRAKGYLRSQLAQRIQLRSFPNLRFNWDPTPENAERIERLIDSLSKDDKSEDD